MASLKGKDALRLYLSRLPEQFLPRVLRGAARAAATVVADEAKLRSISDDVSAAIKVRTKLEDGKVVGRIIVAMGRNNLPLWLEYGTDPHFITVDDGQRGGLGIKRINAKVGEAKGQGSLVIGGKFVGTTVFHPGAQAHPFLRPSLDIKEAEAMRAAQHYISTRVKRSGIVGQDAGDDA